MARLRDPVVVATFGGALAGVVFLVTFLILESRRADLIFEAGKAALVAVPAAIFGFVVAELVRERDERRKEEERLRADKVASDHRELADNRARDEKERDAERARQEKERDAERAREEKERDAERAREEREREAQRKIELSLREYRRRFLDDVVVSYNRIKGVRRNLRAAGFGTVATGLLSENQLQQLDTQMAALNESELELERMKRRMEAGSDVFPTAPAIHAALKGLEEYANGVIKEWEAGRSLLLVDTPMEHFKEWKALQGFLASTHESQKGNFGIAAGYMTDVEKAIWPELIAYREPDPVTPGT